MPFELKQLHAVCADGLNVHVSTLIFLSNLFVCEPLYPGEYGRKATFLVVPADVLLFVMETGVRTGGKRAWLESDFYNLMFDGINHKFCGTANLKFFHDI